MDAKKLMFGAALAALSSVGALSATATDANAQATTRWSGAPRTDEEDRQFKINGRVQYDVFNISADYTTGTDVDYTRSFTRRAFFGAEGRFTQNWRYNIKFDLSPGQSDSSGQGNEVRLDDFYLEYAGETFSIFLGQHNAVSHMEDRISSNYTPFNERSAIDQAFGFGKIAGVAALFSGGNWSLGAGVQGDTFNNGETLNQDEQLGFIARGTWAPIYQRTPEGTTVLHLGLNARYRSLDQTNGLTYSARPNMNSATGLGSTVSTGATYENDTLYGAEAALVWNNFGISGEYMQLNGETLAGVENDYQGGYIDLFWGITGEGRNYSASDGSFGRITPRRTLGSDGGIGAVYAQLRYDWIDLTDGAVIGGEQTGWVAGLTWQPIAYVKFQANYSQYEIDRPGSATDGQVDGFSLRTQFDW
ncbi:MAG: OprO/OprP family phosphate-selective porin [Hyphomonadaceae bacterium]